MARKHEHRSISTDNSGDFLCRIRGFRFWVGNTKPKELVSYSKANWDNIMFDRTCDPIFGNLSFLHLNIIILMQSTIYLHFANVQV